MRFAAPCLRPGLEEGTCPIDVFVPWQDVLCKHLETHLVPHIGTALKQVAIKRMENYLFGISLE